MSQDFYARIDVDFATTLKCLIEYTDIVVKEWDCEHDEEWKHIKSLLQQAHQEYWDIQE